jgi:hypothetical protein
MFTHPDITVAVAAERRRDQHAWADARRLAHATTRRPRDSRGSAITRQLTRIIRRTATAATAATARTA